MNGYFLRGVEGDHILVIRTDDPEDIHRVIKRLCASRDKQMRALAEKLELQWYKRQYDREHNKKK